MAEEYIADKFKKAGLKEFEQFPGYRHEFTYTRRGRRNQQRPAQEYLLTNIIGYLEGNDPQLKDEFILFGAHHDHIGVRGNAADNIYNGAEDNATGTTAVITLAEYFAKTRDFKRSIMFVTFTAEESGMIGSRQLVKELPVPKEKIIAVINFEMIGKASDDGDAECYLTGWDRSDLGEIMVTALGDDPLDLYEGPERTKSLFFASDNISFAREDIVAHTLAGIQSVDDSLAHHPDDEYETLNVVTMTRIIKGVIKASRTLLTGEATPTFFKPVNR
jgi:Zn-dependent M28 family amino/carboxypeptidase